MQICMKPTGKQLAAVRADIAAKMNAKPRSFAEIGRLAGVHPSQVSRICGGDFQTFSNNVVQICSVLQVKLPATMETPPADTSPEWVAAQASMRRIWDKTPEGARAISKLLNAVADLRASDTESAG